MNKFTKFLYAFIMVIVFTAATAFGQCPNGTYLDIIINPDQYPEETSWAVLDENLDTIVTGGPYDNIVDYSPQVTQLCVPNGDYEFVISDGYGDGIQGSLWGGQDGSYYLIRCNDTIVEMDSANFGFVSYHGFTVEDCAPPPPIYGCMDDSFLEFLPIATVDTGMCFTEKVFGCTDSLAYNYIDSANTDILIDSCTHTLELTDLAGNGWAGAYLQVFQGNNFLGIFTLDDGFDTTFTFDLSISEPISVKFNITQQSQFTSVQCGYSVYSDEHVAIDAPGGFASPLVPFVIVNGMPYCGDECIERTYGCIDSLAVNYNDTVNTDDGTCYYNPGCTNPLYLEYDALYDYNDGSCATLVAYGCMDSTALNYDPLANTELPNSCIAIIEGCTDSTMFNYNVNANVDDGNCIPFMYGCTDVTAFNYDSLANTDDGTCIPVVWGCTDGTAFNYNPLANSDDGSCLPVIFGCTDNTMFNYDANANTDNGSCIPFYYGCTDSTAINYDGNANTDNGSCVYPVLGCNDPSAVNYNPLVNVADSSCYYSAGCNSGDVYYIPNECFEWVIAIDPYCCNTVWDGGCDNLYAYCVDGWSGPTDVAMFERLGMLPYPNPSTGIVNFTAEVDIKVYNMLGKLVLQDKTNTVKLDKGIYLIKISKENLNITTKVIIE
jgi:hypothetical protein